MTDSLHTSKPTLLLLALEGICIHRLVQINALNSNTGDREADGFLWVQGKPGLHSKHFSKTRFYSLAQAGPDLVILLPQLPQEAGDYRQEPLGVFVLLRNSGGRVC